MPQLQILTLDDRDGNDVTFQPRDIVAGVGAVAVNTGVPLGEPTVTVSVKKDRNARKAVVQIRGSFPIVQTETINGISTPRVVRARNVDVTFKFDNSTSENERKDVAAYVSSMFANTEAAKLTYQAVTQLTGVY